MRGAGSGEITGTCSVWGGAGEFTVSAVAPCLLYCGGFSRACSTCGEPVAVCQKFSVVSVRRLIPDAIDVVIPDPRFILGSC